MKTWKKVKVAVVGCGVISEIYFENMTRNFEIIEVVGCCDLDTELCHKIAEMYKIKAMTIKDILNDSEIEIVVNLTNPVAHFEVIKNLLTNGKNVYTEKVLVADINQAKELVYLAECKQRLLCSAPDTFLGAAVQTTRYLVESGIIGKVTSCTAVLQRDANLLAEKFPYTFKHGGGIGIDVGIYYSTALINILGVAEEVCGMSGIMFPEQKHYFIKNDNFDETYMQESETYLSGIVRFKSGCIGNLQFNSRSIRTEKPYVALYGTEGIIFLEDPNFFGGDVRLILKGQTDPIIFPHTHAYNGNDRGIGVAEMAWALRKGRLPRTDGKMALHALEILTGIIESEKTKQFYQLKHMFQMTPSIPKGYLGNEYAGSQAEVGLSL
jgi:Predicted dehydrogenases and related proteins